ncbi:hypothetical protein [Vibrio rhizosphaerae]|uniref:Uncharacterized protein n=1 Tax=Vibrio rhizosphaerae TaxID=398736 RepID=A0ABU4IQS4_9VIBR|nr:hypothetical protein [Vibrio rhizosphaerae]MDW6091757.1 hypothetical protein [Vibrio rhizosphaerae]
MKYICFLLLMAVFNGQSLASDNLTGHVVYTGLYGDGRFFIATDTQINEPGCTKTRIDVAPNHPQIDRWLSIALAANATGKLVQFKTNGCYKDHPTLDTTDSSWFHSKFSD